MTDSSERREVLFNHVGVCVTNIERSRRFYTEALGFVYWWELEVPDGPTGQLMRLSPPLATTAVYLVLGRFVLELIHYAEGGTRQAPERVMNNTGLTHLSLAVDDMPAVLEKVEANGGSILADTDIGGLAIMIKDPDGQLIELTTHGFRERRPPWPAETIQD